MSSLAASPLWAQETNSTSINLSSSTQLSSEGYFVLTWDADTALKESLSGTNSELLLYQADNREMQNARLRQKLPLQGAITLSGLDNGDFYFRVDAPQSSSAVIHVEVKHHSLHKALVFFSIGLLLFCILGISIFIGHKKSGPEPSGKSAA